MNAALTGERIVIRAPRHEEFVVAGCLQDYLARLYVAIVFVYESRVTLDALASALPKTLEAFPIFAGSIESANLSVRITCDNRGVALSQTQYPGSYAMLAAAPLNEQRRLFLDLPSRQWRASGWEAPRIAAEIRRSVREHHPSHWPTLRLVEATRGRRLWPKAFNPMRATLYNSNWSKLGLYDARLDTRAPLYVFPLSDVPFPWTSCLIESHRNEGRQFIAVVPPSVARCMRRPEVLAQVHAYRPDSVPAFVQTHLL